MGPTSLTQGGIFKKLVLLALPIMGGQFMNMAYTLADIFWLGLYSSGAVAASATAMMYLWLAIAVMLFLRTGTEIGVSQNIGRGDRAGAQEYAERCLTLSVVLGVVIAAIFIGARQPLIGLFAIQEAWVVSEAERFLAVTALSIPLLFVSGTISACFQASGDTRTPFFILSTGVVTNIVMDPIFIFLMGMGTIGAAYATLVARVLEISLYVWAIRRKTVRPFEKVRFFSLPKLWLWDKVHRDILRWGTPVAVESGMFTILSMIIARFVAEWGTGAMAVQRVGFQVEALSWLVGMGFGIAVTAFIGQNYGARKFGRIHSVFKISLLTMTVYGFFVSLLLYFGGEHIIGLFLHDPEEVRMGGNLLRTLAFVQIPTAFEASMAGCFRGRGLTLPPSITSITCNSLRVPLAFYLSQGPLGLDGIWIAVAIGAAMRGILILLWMLWDKRNIPSEDAHV